MDDTHGDPSPRQVAWRLLGTAVLAAALASGAVWAAARPARQHLLREADRHVALAVDSFRLAEASSRLAAATRHLETAEDDRRRAGVREGLRRQAGDVAALLGALARGGLDKAHVEALRRPVSGIDANIADLDHVVERRIAIAAELREAVERVPERHAAYLGVLSTLTEETLRALRETAGPMPPADLLRTRDALMELGHTVADQLLTGAAMTQPGRLTEAQRAFQGHAGRLDLLLGRLPIGPASARRADAGRQLVALGLDTGNVFELRREHLALLGEASDLSRNSLDKAADIAAAAERAVATLHDGSAETRAAAAGLLQAAPALAGSAALLAVLIGGLLPTIRRRTAAPSPAQEPPAGHRILLAEDEPINQVAVTAMLRRAGHAVTLAANGREAVEAMERGSFDLVLMDLRMPEMDGEEAVRRIRALPDPRRARVPVAMLTASIVPEDAERCRAAGADAVLSKPLRLDALRVLLNEPDAPPPPAEDEVFSEAAILTMREALPPERVAALIAGTVTTLGNYRIALDEAWRTGDRATVGAMAHKVAGVAGIYGCMALRRAAQRLELCIESGTEDPAPLVATLQSAYGPALAALESQRA